MSLESFKLLAALSIWIIALIGAGFSKRLIEQSTQGALLSLANCFAGGVFLAAGLIHVLPDSQGQLAVAFPNMDYPLFGLIATSAVALMVFIDRLGARQGDADSSGVAAAILFLILSIHSVITGFALGIEAQGVAALALLIAVLAHKGTATFALGLKVRPVSDSSMQFNLRMLAFSLTTPLGVLVGLGLLNRLSATQAPMMEGIFDAIAAGTFIYVAIFEILSPEFDRAKHPFGQVITMVAGAGLMALVALWT